MFILEPDQAIICCQQRPAIGMRHAVGPLNKLSVLDVRMISAKLHSTWLEGQVKSTSTYLLACQLIKLKCPLRHVPAGIASIHASLDILAASDNTTMFYLLKYFACFSLISL